MEALKQSRPAIEGNSEPVNMKPPDKDTQFNDRTALSHLRDLHLQRQRFKYPSLPYYSAPTFSATKTNGLTKCIIHFLQLKGHQAERISSEGRVIDTRQTFTDGIGLTRTIGSVQRIKSSATRDTADISATINGISVKVEVKNAATRDRQSEAQKSYQHSIEAAGGMYFIATSFAQFVNWFYQNLWRKVR